MLDALVDLLAEPAILIGIIILIGLLLQKKKFHEVITPTLKGMVGFVVMASAAGIIVTSLEPLGIMFEEAFSVQGVIPNNEAIVAMAITDFGQVTALIMIFGMIANILIARFTNFKYIFLTGHHTLYMACMIAVILVSSGMSNLMAVINGSLVLGLTMVIFPAIAQPYMKKVMNTDQVAMGHFSSLGYALSGAIGSVVGNKEKTTETINVPKGIGFLRDSTVSITLTMAVIYITAAFMAGPEFVETELSNSKNFLVYALMLSLQFAAGFIIIQTGVRMILAEIIPAFKGISEKLVPNAVPALDVPIVYPVAPNAVIIGFIFSFIGGIISMFLLALMGQVIIIPGVVPHFFTGAAAGVFGNATGGRRGAVIGSFVNGMLISFLPVLLLPVLGSLGVANSTFSDSDFAVTGIILGNSIKFISTYALTAILLFIIAVMAIVPKIRKGRK